MRERELERERASLRERERERERQAKKVTCQLSKDLTERRTNKEKSILLKDLQSLHHPSSEYPALHHQFHHTLNSAGKTGNIC